METLDGAQLAQEVRAAQGRTRTFRLIRDRDISGVSGLGVVANGVELPTGRVVLEWCATTQTGVQSLGIYQNIGEVEQIHGHQGATRVEWYSTDVPPQVAADAQAWLTSAREASPAAI